MYDLSRGTAPRASASVSGHKFHGPKGVGFLYARDGAPLEPLMDGGRQERGLRAKGLEPVSLDRLLRTPVAGKRYYARG